MAINNDYSNVSAAEAVQKLNEILFSGDPSAAISNEKLEEIQNLLNIAGFDSGTPDGFEGPNTANALAGFINREGNPSYNEANPEGRVNSSLDRIVKTYATADNVRTYQQMFGPARFSAEIMQETNAEGLENIERLLNAPINETNTIALQTALEEAGLAPGTIDGDWGPKTAGACLQHLRDHHDVLLSMDRGNLEFILDKADPQDLAYFQDSLRRDPAFYDLLKSKLDAVEGELSSVPREQLAEVQQLMTAAGYYDRGIDGIYGSGTQAGVDAFNATERPPEITPLSITITPDPQDAQPEQVAVTASEDTEVEPEQPIADAIAEAASIEEPEQPAAEAIAEAALEETPETEPDQVESLVEAANAIDESQPVVEPTALESTASASPEVMQNIYARLATLDPKLIDIASVNIQFTHGNVMQSVEAETAYEQGMANDATTMVELSELDMARTTARMTFEFSFEKGVFTPEDVAGMMQEIERMEQGLHPSTGRPIQEVQVGDKTYLISSTAEEGYTYDFNTISQVIPETGDADLTIGSPQPASGLAFT